MTKTLALLESIKKIHRKIRDEVIDICERAAIDELSQIAREEDGDTIYTIDRISEERILDFFDQEIASLDPIVLIADIRPLMEKKLAKRGFPLGICCHPYDVCTELVARETGFIVTDEMGHPLRSPLSVDENISWIGYANEHIRNQIEPLLQSALSKRELL